MGAGSVDRTPHARAPQIGKSKRWRIRVSIPVPRRCERRTLPIELIPHRSVTGVGFEPTPPKRLVPKTSALDHSAIQPFSMPKKGCSCRGSNPGPSAHKTEALPTAPQELEKDAKRCLRWGSNPRPWDYETHALPTAPQRLKIKCVIRESNPGHLVGNEVS